MAFDCLPLDRRITTLAYHMYSKESSKQKNRKKSLYSYSRKIDRKNGRLPLKSEALAGLHYMVNKPFLLLGLAAEYRSRRRRRRCANNIVADHYMFITLTGQLS